MTEPIFWLGVSLLLVAISLTAVLIAAIPAFRELARAARSAEKLFDTLSRDLPPTLESIRRTGVEITDLTENVSEGVQSAGRVVQQVDQSIVGVTQQAKRAHSTTRSVWVGVKAAWKTFYRPTPSRQTPEQFSAKMKRTFDPAPVPKRQESLPGASSHPSTEHQRYGDEYESSDAFEVREESYEAIRYSQVRERDTQELTPDQPDGFPSPMDANGDRPL